MFLTTIHLLVFVTPAWTITNNADLIWFDEEGKAQHHYARQPYPEGFNQTKKIVINKKFPILWEVKFGFCGNLEELVIDNCEVNEIKANTFIDLKPLTNLSMAFNNLKMITEGIFNFVQVRNLNFSNNKIQTITKETFDNMPLLEKLILDFNELRQWNNDWFFNSPALTTVSMTHNFLEEIPPRVFKNFKSQKVNFYFSNNKIQRIDREAFEGIGDLGDLFLDWNDIPRVDAHTFEKLTSVQHLGLNGNSLQCLSEEFINNVMNKTELVNVLENPFKCECLKELKKREGKFKAKVLYPKQQSVDC